MSQPSKTHTSKRPAGLKKSKSQAWSWPHLVSVQPKKSATSSLYTPDEQTEISPMTESENSHRETSPPRSSASSTTGSIVVSRGTAVSEKQNTQQEKSEMKRNTEETAPLAEDSFQHGKDASHQLAEEQNTQQEKSEMKRDTEETAPLAEDSFQHGKDANHQLAEEGTQSRLVEEENYQHAEGDNKIASELEKVDEKASRSGDECLDRLTHEPYDESNCDHGEESSQSSSAASAHAEEHAAHPEGAKRTPESSESRIEEQTVANPTDNRLHDISDRPSGRKVESQHDSPKTEAVIQPDIIQSGEELSRTDSPVIVRDFGTPPLQEDTASLKKASTLPPPRIFVQRASDATDSSTLFPTPAASGSEEQPRGPYPSEESNRSSGESHGADPLASRIAIPPEITSNLSHSTEDSEKPKVKKRKLVVRKTRNLMMRKHFLQLVLGRQLAAQTKPALRLLAHGEPVKVEPAVAGKRDPMLHMSEGSMLSLPRHGR